MRNSTKEKSLQKITFSEPKVLRKSISLQQTIIQNGQQLQNHNIEGLEERYSKIFGKGGSVIYLYYQLQSEDKSIELKQSQCPKIQSMPNCRLDQETGQVQRKQFLKSYSQSSFYSNIGKIESEIQLEIQKKWIKQNGILNHNTIMFFSRHYPISQISKIKIFPLQTVNQFSRIRFVTPSKIVHFAVNNHAKFQGLSFHYLWFFKVIQQKLKLCFDPQISYQSLQLKPLQKQCLMEGIIFKKSQFLGQWKRRYIRIDSDGIHSMISDKQTFFIPKKQIKYLWTRFSIYEKKYLVIKVMHISKTQFAIPMDQFLSQVGLCSWLYAFYQVMPI